MKKSIFAFILLLAWCGAAYGFSDNSGDGSPGNPYKVQTVAHLAMVVNGVNGALDDYYIQVADIDLNGHDPDADGSGWIPIAGGGTESIFTGSYDGQNYTISNLTINRSLTDNVGLFGHVGQGAVIKNVRLVNVDVQGRRGAGSLIGRVTGNSQTLIYRCYADGGSVVGFDGATGGLVGSHNSVQQTPGGENNPVISECFANINVSLGSPDGDGKDKFGGLVGCSQKGTILDSYARGSVTVEDDNAQRVGGLAGCIEFRGRILRSYSTGEVSVAPGTALFGGLVGRIGTGGNQGIILDAYWDTETSNQATSAGGTGKSTADMTTQSTFVDWEFDTIWGMDTENDGYPYLLWADSTPVAGGIQWTGTTDSNWNTAGNWSSATVPTSIDDVTIPASATLYPVIGPDVIAHVNDLTVNTGATLTIESNSTNTGSLIVQGIFYGDGDVIVERYLEDDRWYIIGPPVIGQSIQALLEAEDNDIAYDETGDKFYGATIYDEANNKWGAYFRADELAGLGDFAAGTGYLLRRIEGTAGGVVRFTGDLETGTVDVPVSTVGFRWNAVGNPYTSAIGVTGNATTAQNFLFTNINNLDSRYLALYVWDDDFGNYVIVNNANFSNVYGEWDTDYVPLGQGFIIRAASALVESVAFMPGMRVGQPALMLKSPIMDKMQAAPVAQAAKTQWPGVVISATVNSGADSASTGITFYEGMTLGLDPGYDAGVYQGNPEVAVYTQLASGDDGVDYGLQCLPPSAMDWIDLPIGLETRRDGTVTFRFEKTGLPQGTVVILEDRKQNSQKTIASTGDTYTATVNASEPAYGRFYLSFADDPGAPSEDPDDQPDNTDGDNGKSSSSGCFVNTVRQK